ncbi:MAG TPA: AAA family ATPase, partial [Candidatus Baltobacteraceae bacterium]|nr:AAA family ATPase [Candidatus Baltobacteraceae bacterium]
MARLAAASPAECTLATLGSFELRIRGKPIPNPATQKARALLSYLVLHRRTDVPRERLVEVFWAEAEPERARDSLNTALHSIRRGLRAAQFEPNDFIFANKSIIRWEAGVDLDVERIERALQTGDRELADAALAQYHGDFLEGDYDEWTVSERERVAGRYEELLAQTLRSTKAPDVAKKLLARNPYDEDAYATLIDAEVAAGRHFSAAQVIQQCRSALNEIGVVPTAAFLEKYAPLERALAKPPPGLEVPFVGRDAELADLAQFIDRKDADAPSVAIVEGEPGIGKTALIAQAVKRAASSGLRTTSLRAVCDDARPFAIWPALYASLSGKDFEDFLAATHGSVATELAEAIATLLPQPSMLAIDDAQYLSGDALATLIAIAKILAAQRAHVLLIGTRPEGLVQLSEGLGELQYAAVHLQPLPDSDVDTALALAGIEMDAATTTVLRTRARGHPLYLKGLLEQLVRSGALRREGMHWELAQPEADLQLPPSLRRLIEARIRARGSDAVLTACALAIEPSANANEIAQASGLNELAVLDALDDLLGHHVIVEPQSGPRPFIFAHDLLE